MATPPNLHCALRITACLLAAMLGSVGPVRSQETAGWVPASVEVSLGLTRVAGVSAGQAGLAATIGLGDRFRAGGGAWAVLRRIDEGEVLAHSGLELSLGYGGVVIDFDPPTLPLFARLMAGGGAATLRTTVVGARFDTETFAVIEPALGIHIPLFGPASTGAVAGYRWIAGADALFLAGNEDLRGLQASLFLRFGMR